MSQRIAIVGAGQSGLQMALVCISSFRDAESVGI